MARKKKNQSKRGGTHEDHSDDESIASNDTYMSISGISETGDGDSGTDEVSSAEKLDETLDELLESRSSLRVKAFNKLMEQLLQCLTRDAISERRESFLSNILGCLKKPSIEEATIACRAMSIVCLTMGPEEDVFYDEVYNTLHPLAKSHKNAKIRIAALKTLALGCFVCSTEEDRTTSIMDLCETYFNSSVSEELCSTALIAWGFLATTLPDSYVVSTFCPRILNTFISLLDHADLEVRASSGENIAFIMESVDKVDEILHERAYITDKIYELSKESSKRNTRRDRKEQRSIFRDIHRTIADGISPELMMTVVHEPMAFTGWCQIKQLNVIKDCLRSGFQEHVQFNGALRQIFELPDVSNGNRASAKDKRKLLSKNSETRKQRSSDLKKLRKRRENQKNSFLMDT